MKPVSELKRNLEHIVSWNSNIQPKNIIADFSNLILITKSVLNDQKIRHEESASKMTKKGKGKG